MYGLEIIRFGTPNINDFIKSNAEEIIQHFNQCSDILLFIQSALAQSCYDLKYSLHPPYTTSKLDCEYILKKLVNTDLIKDFYYSSISKSYRIILNSISGYNIKTILYIGLSSLLEKISVTDIIFNSCFKTEEGKFISADLACLFNNKILLINFEIAVGLEKDVVSHSEQLKKMKDKLLKSYAFENNSNICKYFVVTPDCKELLPSHKQIISFNDLIELIK